MPNNSRPGLRAVASERPIVHKQVASPANAREGQDGRTCHLFRSVQGEPPTKENCCRLISPWSTTTYLNILEKDLNRGRRLVLPGIRGFVVCAVG